MALSPSIGSNTHPTLVKPNQAQYRAPIQDPRTPQSKSRGIGRDSWVERKLGTVGLPGKNMLSSSHISCLKVSPHVPFPNKLSWTVAKRISLEKSELRKIFRPHENCHTQRPESSFRYVDPLIPYP